MAEDKALEYWSVWYSKAAATGMLLARGRLDHTAVLLVHAVPEVMTVEVHDEQGRRLAYGKDLQQTLSSPICRLSRQGERIEREDIWPGAEDIGQLVLLPGGEVGTLKAWWHADDRKEWRWQVEFYNTLR
ncbi:MAG TPA: hypothetical protein GX702_03805 [Chloroflexi bacterium]|jgi:hypothetical protein|nr:hypothetical protein [Chloroflexota bacterium]